MQEANSLHLITNACDLINPALILSVLYPHVQNLDVWWEQMLDLCSSEILLISSKMAPWVTVGHRSREQTGPTTAMHMGPQGIIQASRRPWIRADDKKGVEKRTTVNSLCHVLFSPRWKGSREDITHTHFHFSKGKSNKCTALGYEHLDRSITVSVTGCSHYKLSKFWNLWKTAAAFSVRNHSSGVVLVQWVQNLPGCGGRKSHGGRSIPQCISAFCPHKDNTPLLPWR